MRHKATGHALPAAEYRTEGIGKRPLRVGCGILNGVAPKSGFGAEQKLMFEVRCFRFCPTSDLRIVISGRRCGRESLCGNVLISFNEKRNHQKPVRSRISRVRSLDTLGRAS